MIIGITGTNAAGKGTVVEYLEKEGFTHFSARKLITAECEKDGVKMPNRDQMIKKANELREKYGSDYIIKSLAKLAQESNKNAVIESVRSIGEIEFLRTIPTFQLWSVDADIKKRYERSVLRANETDSVSFEKFCELQEKENNGSSRSTQNIKGCMELADVKLKNNGEITELNAQIKKILQSLS